MSNWTPPCFVQLGNIFIGSQVWKDESTGNTICTTTRINLATGQKKVINKILEENK